MYLFKGSIYTTLQDLAIAHASQCSTIVSNGYVLCSIPGDDTKVRIKHYDFDGVLLNSNNYSPPQILAPDLITDYVSISMGIILVWVVAWGFRTLIRQVN